MSGHVSGFEPYGVLDHKKKLVQTVVKKQLTKYLSKRAKHLNVPYEANKLPQDTVTKPLSEEATYALNVIFGEAPGMIHSPSTLH